jgi:hypothetical protein
MEMDMEKHIFVHFWIDKHPSITGYPTWILEFSWEAQWTCDPSRSRVTLALENVMNRFSSTNDSQMRIATRGSYLLNCE